MAEKRSSEPLDSEKKEDEEDEPDRLQTILSFAIAFLTALGALAVWQSSVLSSQSADETSAGIQSSLDLAEARALIFANAYENYRMFTEYKRHHDLSLALIEASKEAPKQVAEEYKVRATDEQTLALANLQLFPNKYLQRDGTYNLQSQMGQLWANAKRMKDLNPKPHFDQAKQLLLRSELLVGVLTIFAFALFFYAIVESTENVKVQVILTIVGSLFAITGITCWLLVQFEVI